VDVSLLNPQPLLKKKKKKIGVFLPSDNPERANLMEKVYDDGGRKCILVVILRVTDLL